MRDDPPVIHRRALISYFWRGGPPAGLDHCGSRARGVISRSPTYFFLLFFTSMKRPLSLLRFVQAVFPASAPLRCVRLRTAPLRALSPTGLLTAMLSSLLWAAARINQKQRQQDRHDDRSWDANAIGKEQEHAPLTRASNASSACSRGSSVILRLEFPSALEHPRTPARPLDANAPGHVRRGARARLSSWR